MNDLRRVVVVPLMSVLLVVIGDSITDASSPNTLREKIEMSGELNIGQSVFFVTCEAKLSDDRCDWLKLTIQSGSATIASIEVAGTEEPPTLKYSGNTYHIDKSLVRTWESFLRLTADDVKQDFIGKETRQEAGKWTWELTEQRLLRPGLPAKAYFVFPSSDDADLKGRAKFTEVVVWSLAEWNNSFNENVVLYLRVTDRSRSSE